MKSDPFFPFFALNWDGQSTASNADEKIIPSLDYENEKRGIDGLGQWMNLWRFGEENGQFGEIIEGSIYIA
jgi:hypothetical protein